MIGRDLTNATIGIVGLGRIGEAVARRASGFGMKIVYHSRGRLPDAEKVFGASYVTLNDLLRISDVVTLHAPLTAETKGMIGLAQFSLMKKSAIFVNASRGGLVVQKDLEEALQKGMIFGAALDVYEKEPLPQDSPLLKMENVVLVPHIGSATVGARSGMAELSARNLIDALDGRVPKALVNPSVLSQRKAP